MRMTHGYWAAFLVTNIVSGVWQCEELVRADVELLVDLHLMVTDLIVVSLLPHSVSDGIVGVGMPRTRSPCACVITSCHSFTVLSCGVKL